MASEDSRNKPGGGKQFGTINLNANNFLYNGLIDELQSIRTGGESALLDNVFNGINICATGCSGGQSYGPVGSTVNGVVQTAAYQMRSRSSFQSDLANGDFEGVASTLNTLNYVKTSTQNTTLPDIPSGVRGAVLRYRG